MGYIFSSQGKVYATIGRSFRAPTYTELYMNNPNFIGDPSLHPETGWSYETGLEYYLNSKIQWNFSVFEHNQANLIDYVKYTAQDRYQVENFTNASTRGIEVSTQWNEPAENNSKGSMFLERIHVAYGYLDSYIQHKPVYSTRYSFTHPRHQVSILIIGMMPFNAQASIGVVHKIKLSGISYTLVDARLAKHFSIVDFYVSGSNLLNQSYEEIVGVPLPGRWLLAGVEVKIL
jgi:iron complex outermembrane receptor protein